jgi:hypothetical protein
MRQLEISLSQELEDLKAARKAVDIKQLEYENKLKQLTAILNKGAGDIGVK